MGVDDGVPICVMLIAHRLDRMVRVRVRRGRQSEKERKHRKRRTKTAQHDSSIVSAGYGRCQASTAGALRIMRTCPTSLVRRLPSFVETSP